MGARVVFNIKQDEGNYICLYSHWGEHTALEDAGRAIAKARPRWGDDSYCARIIVSQLIGNEWDSETGFGLWASSSDGAYGGDHPDIIIDLVNRTVQDETGTHSFTDFINYHAAPVTV